MFESYETMCTGCGEWEETMLSNDGTSPLNICGPCYDNGHRNSLSGS